MLRIYRDKQGYTFQYEEGTQPEGLELVDEPKPKAEKAANKAKKPANKSAKKATKTEA